MLLAARLQLQDNGFVDLVVIVDGLEKMRHRILKDNESSYSDFFITHAEQLTAPDCHIVYTMPIAVSFSFNTSDFYTDRTFVLPMVKYQKPEGQAQLIALLQKRLQVDRLFANRQLLVDLINMSGGSIRDLFHLVRAACETAENTIKQADVDRAVRNLVKDYDRMVQKDFVPLLNEVDIDRRLPTDGDKKYESLLRLRLVHEYENGEQLGRVASGLKPYWLVTGRLYQIARNLCTNKVMNSTAPDLFSQHPELKHLRRALQLCKGFGLYFVSCNTVPLRHELVAALKAHLATPIVELPLNPENDIFIDAQMMALLAAASADAIVFIYDLEKLYHLKDRHVIQELNWRREFYGRGNHPVVFWLPDFLLTEIFNEAPDFADWRSGLYEFTLSQPEQLSLMHSTWESVNENFVGQLSLSEKQRWIVNLENLLAELAGQEASKTKASLLNHLGRLYDSLGKYDQALTCYRQSLKIRQDIGDKEGESVTLNNISFIYHIKGDYGTALRYLEQSLKIRQDIGDKEGEGTTLNNISQIHKAQGDYGTALRYLEQSLQICQDIGDKSQEGATLNNISQIYHAQGDYGIALRYLEQSLKIRQDIGDKQGEGVTLNNLSLIYRAKGDNAALRYLEQSLKICQDVGDKQGEGTALNNISQIYDAQGDYGVALRYLELSLKIRQDIGDKQGEGATLNNLSQIYDAQGDYGTALRYLEQSLQISQGIGDVANECVTLFNIGHIHWQNNEQQQALSIWLKAYRIAKQIDLAQALKNLDKLAKDLGHEGLAWWESLNPGTLT